MRIIEPSIIIGRTGDKLTSISVAMPVKVERSFDGSLKVNLPLFGTHSWANDENGVEKAVEAEVILFCRGAEKFGDGIEKELQYLGWKMVSVKDEVRVFAYRVSNTDVRLAGMLRKDPNHFNRRLEIT